MAQGRRPRPRASRKRRRASSGPWRWPASAKPGPGSCAPLRAWPGCGSNRAGSRRRALCLLRSMVGSPRALIRPTLNRRRRCLTSCDRRLGLDRANDRNRREGDTQHRATLDCRSALAVGVQTEATLGCAGRFRCADLAAARRLGRTGGRPPKLTDDDIEAAKAMLANPDIAVTQVAHRLGVSPATLYRYIPAARTANLPDG